jgi:hypothetical protein
MIIVQTEPCGQAVAEGDDKGPPGFAGGFAGAKDDVEDAAPVDD